MLKLGVIGLSDGNGHPYSWSAIFNGYDHEKMEDCGFPSIPQYLAEQSWPSARIQGARVTSVWTQDRELSEKIATSALIDDVADSPGAMIDQVDAVLLARDDAENHRIYAEPFLKAGKPVYIDKPIALNGDELDALYALEQYSGQIFTCSALRYSKELKLTDVDRDELGEIREIHAVTPKSWNKYAVHIIEPVIGLLAPQDQHVEFVRPKRQKAIAGESSLTVSWRSGVVTRFFALGDATSPLSIRVFGTKGWKELMFSDSFTAFKIALQHFVDGINTGTTRSPRDFNHRVVELIEAGNR